MGNELSAAREELYIRSVFDVMDRHSSSSRSTKTENEAINTNMPASSMYGSPRTQKKNFDLSPKNLNIAVYCRSLINIHFTGQNPMPYNEGSNGLAVSTAEDNVALGDGLAAIDGLLRTVDNDFSGHEEEFIYYLQACAEARGCDMLLRSKFMQDAFRFVQIYKNRKCLSEELTHLDYWGSRQQMLSAKVVADWIDPEYGPLDPVFGCLLNPTLGRTGPGDSGWVHKMLFDDDGPMAYHSAVHDAFGYLITYHDIGPGYDYLGAWTLFESHTPLSGQLSGLKFWNSILKEETNIPIKKL